MIKMRTDFICRLQSSIFLLSQHESQVLLLWHFRKNTTQYGFSRPQQNPICLWLHDHDINTLTKQIEVKMFHNIFVTEDMSNMKSDDDKRWPHKWRLIRSKTINLSEIIASAVNILFTIWCQYVTTIWSETWGSVDFVLRSLTSEVSAAISTKTFRKN